MNARLDPDSAQQDDVPNRYRHSGTLFSYALACINLPTAITVANGLVSVILVVGTWFLVGILNFQYIHRVETHRIRKFNILLILPNLCLVALAFVFPYGGDGMVFVFSWLYLGIPILLFTVITGYFHLKAV